MCQLSVSYADDRFEGGSSFAKSAFAVQRSMPHFAIGSPIRESFFHNDRIDDAENGYGGAVQAVVFGGRSTNECEIAQYLLPNCQSKLVVTNENEDNADQEPVERDVAARHLNIRLQNGLLNNGQQKFKSVLRFHPEVSQVGAALSWKQALCYDDDQQVRWWSEIGLPIVHVTTDMQLQENIQEGREATVVQGEGLNGSPVLTSAKQFFAQRGLQFGRIDRGEQDETQVASLDMKIGYNSVMTDQCYLNSYLGISIPTSNNFNERDDHGICEQSFRQMLQPLTGTAGHVALAYGTHLGFHICDYEQWRLRTVTDIHTRYIFSDEEHRTFDLKGKPWSRYMEFYASEDQAARAFRENDPTIGTSGVNLLTLPVDVTPGVEGRVNFACIFERCNFALEVGYNTNYQQAEDIELCSRINRTFALKSSQLQDVGTVNRATTIKRDFPGLEPAPANEQEVRQFVRDAAVTTSDIDLTTASHPATLHHTLYAHFGYNFEHNCIPGFAGIGASYTVGATNNEMDNWALWAKFGISF